jgi:hypothetical protein
MILLYLTILLLTHPPIYFTFIKYSQSFVCVSGERNSHSPLPLPLPLRKMWVGTHPTNQKHGNGNGNGNGQWQTHSLYLGREVARGLSLKMNGQGERKGNAHHHQINSTQSKSSHHHQTNKVTQKTKANQTSFKTHTHTTSSFLLCDRCSTFVRPFQ